MTRTLRHVLAASACLLAVNSAHAQLSALGGLASSLGGMLAGATGIGTADAGYDVDGFVRKSADLSEVASRAVTAINAAFATDEQLTAKRAALAAIAAVAEPKERQTVTLPCTRPKARSMTLVELKMNSCVQQRSWKTRSALENKHVAGTPDSH